MSLLKHLTHLGCAGPSYYFTFHYVSIKTYHSYHAPPVTGIFTFHYVSIKTFFKISIVVEPYFVFTFHYVSIKTFSPFNSQNCLYIFTFHYVSIKTVYWLRLQCCFHTLHSTMSLLKLNNPVSLCNFVTLHSTMSLLKPKAQRTGCSMCGFFTFHYVSIKTCWISQVDFLRETLHSTMSLLKQLWC